MTYRIQSDGARVELSPVEQGEFNARLLAHDGESVHQMREQRRAEFRAQADARISSFTGPAQDQMRVVIRQVNMLGAAVRALRKETRGDATATAGLDALDAVYTMIDAIRTAENAASAALDRAGVDERMTPAERIAEIDALSVEWPV